MSSHSLTVGDYPFEEDITQAERATIVSMAERALTEIRTNDQCLMVFDDFVEWLEDQNLREGLVVEIIAYLELHNWAVRVQLADSVEYMQGVPAE